MKKVITLCLLIFSLLAGGTSLEAKTTKKKSNSKAGTAQTSSAKSLSKKDQMVGILKKYRNQQTDGYFITDINNDGNPELWIDCYGDVATNGHKDIYYFDKNGVLKKDVLQTGRRAHDFCYKNGKLYLVYENLIYEISLQNNKIHRNLILEFDMDWGEQDGEPKSFSKGSKQLWRSFQNLPLIEFFPIRDTTHINNYFK